MVETMVTLALCAPSLGLVSVLVANLVKTKRAACAARK
jgi:hypothetical protein